MRIPHSQRGRKLGINMTPMIDVVFLLIIFFLVSSHLNRQETQIELPLPLAASGVETPLATPPRVTLNIRGDGKILLAGQELPPTALADKLREFREAQGPDLEVRIRGSRQTAYAFVEPIMIACTQVGIWNVSFAVWEREGQQ